MKKFSKLLAVVVAIAVVVCPMMSIVSSATSTGGYKIEALDENNLKLTISSTDGFIAYSASVGFNSASAFQSTYSSDGYTNGVKLIDYTTKTASKNAYNTPQISANATGSALNVVVMPTDINNLDLLTEVVIGLRVANGTTASLTKVQAADDGADITEDPTLLSFPAADANTGAIDSTDPEYISSNATTNAHSHSFTQQTQTDAYLITAATCSADATYWYSCATCGLASSTDYFTATGTKLAHTPAAAVTENTVAATCSATGSYDSVVYCSVCSAEISRTPNVIAKLAHTVVEDAAVAATCTATGLTAGSHCSVCNEVIVAQTVVPTTAHSFGEYVADGNATCENDGTKTRTCSVCGATETVADTGSHSSVAHTVVEDAAVAATCTATGLTAGSHCSVCGEVIVAQTVVPATGHSFTYTENGNGTHTVGCANGCGYSATEDCDTEGADGACSKCGYKAEVACTHNYVGVVTTQPTKNATGVMTYTCSLCGDSYTETIAMPTATTSVAFSHALNVSAVVADSITVSTKQIRTNYGNGATYFIDINYQTYSDPTDLYNLTMGHVVLTASDRETGSGTSTANKDVIFFKKMALYEMTLEFDMTLYIVDENGVVVAYRSYNSSIAQLALEMAQAYESNTALLTMLADMCNYGKAAQEFFAAANSTKDIVDAVDPTTIFADYMANASDVAILPGAGEYDNTLLATQKVVSSTGFISAGMTLNIGASNRIAYTLRADGYELDDCSIVMSYTSLYGEKEFEVDMSEVTPNGLTGAGKQKYLYQFGDLALYDLNAVVTMSMYHNDVLECTSQYSIGNFVNKYVGNSDEMGNMVKTMELFANSTAIALSFDPLF